MLISKDLDALLVLCDRIVVMSEGRVVFEVNPSEADRKVLGAHIDGSIHHSTTLKQERAAA